MLNAKQIKSNKERFLTLNEKHNFFTKELLGFLGEEFFVAPASTATDMYSAYPGGLVHHLYRVCKYSIEINNLLPESKRIEKVKLMKTVFISQIGKVYLFKPNESEWHRQNLGKMYEYRDRDGEIIALAVGERSIRYATQNGVKLEDDEYQAIINVDNDSRKSFKWNTETLSHVIKLGFDMALLEEKK